MDNISDALEKLKGGEEYQVVFIDFVEPVSTSLTALEYFNQWKQSNYDNFPEDTLMIGTSTTASDEQQSKSFEYGIHFFCCKPTDIEIFSIIIESCRQYNLISDICHNIRLSTKLFKSGIRFPLKEGNEQFHTEGN